MRDAAVQRSLVCDAAPSMEARLAAASLTLAHSYRDLRSRVRMGVRPPLSWRLAPQAALCFIIVWCLVMVATSSRRIKSVGAARLPPLPSAVPSAQTLSFAPCAGMAYQRMSIVYGLLLARMLERDAILPDLLVDDDVPHRNSDRVALEMVQKELPFEGVYDLLALAAAAGRHGLRVFTVRTATPNRRIQRVSLAETDQGGVDRIRAHAMEQHVDVDCPLWSVTAEAMTEHESFVMDVLAALVPTSSRALMVDTMVRQLTHGMQSERGAGRMAGIFDALHLRYEKDWVEHCRMWETVSDGVPHDNCGLLSASELLSKLSWMGLAEDGVPLYIVVDEDNLPDNDSVLRILRAAFNVVTRKDLLHHNSKDLTSKITREEVALLEFFVCKRARTFVGNSVSSFSALLILERRAEGGIGTWYNGGSIPLEAMIPFFRMPWVFSWDES